MAKHIGNQSIRLDNPVSIIGHSSLAGRKEHEGPLGEYFSLCIPDALWGEKTFEKCEQKMFKEAVYLAVQNAGKVMRDIDLLLGGDLLNQIVSSGYSARDLSLPFLGLYGACSTMAQSLLTGAMLIDSGSFNRIVCCTSSHFATAERQFRVPLELGSPRTPTSQNTVTGAGATVLSRYDASHLCISGGTVGKVIDLGISDAENMGAAMAPAACDTILNHFRDFKVSAEDYDAIVTGDLGTFGSEVLLDMLMERGTDISKKHKDCGAMIFSGMDKIKCGGSGCGCCAVILNGYFLKMLELSELKRILFIATGALLSPTIVQQGESIPAIAHAVIIERNEK